MKSVTGLKPTWNFFFLSAMYRASRMSFLPVMSMLYQFCSAHELFMNTHHHCQDAQAYYYIDSCINLEILPRVIIEMFKIIQRS